MKQFTLIVLAGLIPLSGCEKNRGDDATRSFKAKPPKKTSSNKGSLKNVYPFDRIITDKRSRKVDAIVVGRTKTEVIFQNKASNNPDKHYYYALSELSSLDRQFFNNLPIKRWEGGGGSVVNSLLRESERLTALIKDKQESKGLTPDAKTRIRSLDREIEKLEQELVQIKIRITEQRQRDASGK
jgi:hypothetical protein